jgi:hypothetical protein
MPSRYIRSSRDRVPAGGNDSSRSDTEEPFLLFFLLVQNLRSSIVGSIR